MSSNEIAKAPARAKVPNEIWALIKTYVPTLSRYVLKELTRHTPGPEDKHSRLWGSIFQNEDWLSTMIERDINPVLIGYDLHHLYSTKNIRKSTKLTYLVLVLGYDGDGGKYERPPTDDKLRLLLASLRPNREADARGEYYFPEIGLILNIRDGMDNQHYTTVSQPGRLVSHQLMGLESAYLYWKDDTFAVRKIDGKYIVGMGKALTKKSVSKIVGLTWVHLPSKRLRQHFFQTMGIEHSAEQLTNGKRGDSFKVTGWKWKTE